MVSLSSTAAQSLIAKVIELDLFRAMQPIHHLAEELEADQANEAKRQWNEDVKRKEKNSALQKQGTKVTTLKRRRHCFADQSSGTQEPSEVAVSS